MQQSSRRSGIQRHRIPNDQEVYRFSWAGRSDCIRARDAPPAFRMGPDRSESINFEATKNMFIEGDNLEAIKLLLASHKNRVKMIYIDPPYNANSVGVYEDDYRESFKNYSRNSRNLKSSSPLEMSGRLHSRWLCMIYPRISLARELLCEDGLIFVSIDDTEFHNLGMIMNEIFGEENVEVMVWKKVESNEGKIKLIRRFRTDHEYILIGYKSKEKTSFKKVMEVPRFRTAPIENPDRDSRGPWVSGNMSMTEKSSIRGGKNYYTIVSPSGKEWSRQWKFSSDEYRRLREDNKIFWGRDGNNVPRLKVFPNEAKPVYVSSIIEEKGTAKSASMELVRLMGYNCFSNPKPVELIQYLIDAAKTEHGIVLDFFAGSGTTAHAVLAQNAIDNGDRSFILVQSPEVPRVGKNSHLEYRKHFKSIADITRKRLATTIELFEKSSSRSKLDLGMKVFKLKKVDGLSRRLPPSRPAAI